MLIDYLTKTFLFCILFTTAFAELSILTPSSLQDWWKSNPDLTTSSLATFGYMPWGRKIIGQLELADPLDACEYINQADKDYTQHPIIVAQRGKCAYVLKSHYAQLAGAKMLLIFDNVDENVTDHLMVDNQGQGDSVRIPVALLSKEAGNQIFQALQKEEATVSSISVLYDFNIAKSDKVSYNMWLSSSTQQAFQFVREWRKYGQKLGPYTHMEPHYIHFSGSDDISNCLCGGRYCAPDPDGDRPNTGADVIKEDLRQMCLFKKYSQKIWESYMINFDATCVSLGDLRRCCAFALSLALINIDEIDECVKASFDNIDISKCTRNTLLEEERTKMQKDQIYSFPSVTINGFIYRGSLSPAKGVFEAVCESFSEMPGVCRQSMHLPANRKLPIIPLVVGLIIFVVVLILGIFCCYRRSIRKEMYARIQKDVSVMVEQYAALKEDRLHKSSNESD